MYYIKGTQNVAGADIKGMAYWKKKWNTGHVLKNGNTYYFCNEIIIADYTEL
jgi:YHS domain-containing protein